ncbi:MAG TPA: geranylgeranylglyceryl/heptaprenylglyceryl phosphate synthase [Bacteroidia bacterium]|nr:geranylgeranylglyceryl/heptaprenylglyceryl phosphate synthase [Bacteroidia bacterium]
MAKSIYNKFTQTHKKQFCVLVDPDKHSLESLKLFSQQLSKTNQVDFILVGGSLLRKNNFEKTIALLKAETDVPVIIFPGNAMQLSAHADAILLLSLISGRNAEMLIGNHVIAAPLIKEANLEAISTGYMLIDGGQTTAVQYMSNTFPIPSNKPEIAAATALAGAMLGMQLIYMDAGSGAHQPVPLSMIKSVKNEISIPLIVGGGIRDAKSVSECCKAGADVIVIGNLFEEKPEMVRALAEAMI